MSKNYEEEEINLYSKWLRKMVDTKDPRLNNCKHPHFYHFNGRDIEGWCALCRKEAVKAENSGEMLKLK